MKFSATTRGFYSESIHGAVITEIPDPDWVRPTIQVQQDDGNGGTIMVDVPDETAVHPLITAPNPDCRIPADAVDILPADYAALLAAQDSGKLIQSDANGYPVAVEPPKETASEMWLHIKEKRDYLTRNGGFNVGSKWYHSDEFSRGQHLGLLAMGANIPANLQWKTMDGSFVTMTPVIAGQILAAAAASDQTIFAAAETHKAAMEAAADPSTYDFSTGWPVTFLG